jgi:hypothetical protein
MEEKEKNAPIGVNDGYHNLSRGRDTLKILSDICRCDHHATVENPYALWEIVTPALDGIIDTVVDVLRDIGRSYDDIGPTAVEA